MSQDVIPGPVPKLGGTGWPPGPVLEEGEAPGLTLPSSTCRVAGTGFHPDVGP